MIESEKNLILDLQTKINFIEENLEKLEMEKSELLKESNVNKYEYLICYKKQLKDFIEDYKSKSQLEEYKKEIYSENLIILNKEVIS